MPSSSSLSFLALGHLAKKCPIFPQLKHFKGSFPLYFPKPFLSFFTSLCLTLVENIGLDMTQAMGVLSKYMSNPGREHWTHLKWVFGYLLDTYLKYSRTKSMVKTLNIQGFVDVDWASDLDSRRSINGYVFTLFKGATRWMSKRC